MHSFANALHLIFCHTTRRRGTSAPGVEAGIKWNSEKSPAAANDPHVSGHAVLWGHECLTGCERQLEHIQRFCGSGGSVKLHFFISKLIDAPLPGVRFLWATNGWRETNSCRLKSRESVFSLLWIWRCVVVWSCAFRNCAYYEFLCERHRYFARRMNRMSGFGNTRLQREKLHLH